MEEGEQIPLSDKFASSVGKGSEECVCVCLHMCVCMCVSSSGHRSCHFPVEASYMPHYLCSPFPLQ